ncbi:MAG: ACP S-malonyltransferase [Chloroflexi bacterium]|nr:ACP S-malonyltransferase [Chloroflexota bacterium]
MSGVAFVFPGQGSQAVGMGAAVYVASRRAREIFEEADRVLGYALSKICFEGPAERLNDTAVAQSAVLTTSVALLEALAEAAEVPHRISDGSEPRGVAALPNGLAPGYVAGHSLGEFTALVAAGVLTFSDALRLVAERGRLASAGGARGAMAAVVGLSADDVDRIIRETAQGGTVVANDNGPTQVTIAGDETSVQRLSAELARRGARLVVPLRISAPFHLPAMGRIGPDLASFMRGLSWREPVVPIVANVSAEPHRSGTIQAMLVRHLSQRVEWLRSVRFMAERGVGTFVELGAGQVVNGLVKRITDARLINISDSTSLRAALAQLRGKTA